MSYVIKEYTINEELVYSTLGVPRAAMTIHGYDDLVIEDLKDENGILGKNLARKMDVASTEIAKWTKKSGFLFFPIFFQRDFALTHKKLNHCFSGILRRRNSFFDDNFSAIVTFAPYIRHLGGLFFRKIKCVALRNCLRKSFYFFMKNHHFLEVPPNS